MKLSDSTLSILKNFSSINQSLLLKPGNTLKTISPLKTIYVEASVGENFSKEVALFDLNKFLAKISLYKDAKLAFEDDRVVVATENNKRSDFIKYCSPKVIVTPPEKSITFGEPDLSFTLSQEDIEWMRKSSGISGSTHYMFECDGEKVYFISTEFDSNNRIVDSADQCKIEIGTATTKFRAVIKVENFKLIDGSYDVSVAKKGLSMFKHKTLSLTYYIAIESAVSSFGEE